MVTWLSVRSPQLSMMRNRGAFWARAIVAWLPLTVRVPEIAGSPAAGSAGVVSVYTQPGASDRVSAVAEAFAAATACTSAPGSHGTLVSARAGGAASATAANAVVTGMTDFLRSDIAT